MSFQFSFVQKDFGISQDEVKKSRWKWSYFNKSLLFNPERDDRSNKLIGTRVLDKLRRQESNVYHIVDFARTLQLRVSDDEGVLSNLEGWKLEKV